METPSSVAVWSSRIAFSGASLFVVGPLLCQLGAPAELGFRLFGLGGVLLGPLALLLGAVGLWTTRSRPGRAYARTGALLGLALFASTFGMLVVSSISAGGAAQLPAINDITTAPLDPPAFVAIAALPANAERDMAYPGDAFRSEQEAAYPDLAPIALAKPPGEALAAARRAATQLGWEIVDEDPVAGRLEATDTTAIFHFVDDVVVRTRPGAQGGSVLDVRSKSRDGRGDLGANAGRIRAFRDALGD